MYGESIGSPTLIIGFVVFILAMLGLDLGVFHRKQHKVSFREALIWSAVWVSLAMVFNLGVYIWFGSGIALEFFTGYVIEKALSVDNLFVFVAIFAYFNIAPKWQHRVLFWGILGALVMRAVFIVVGGAMLTHFHWTMYLFGGVLILTGIKLFFQKHQEIAIDRTLIVRGLKRFFPMTDKHHGARFFIKQGGRWFITPLFLALVTVEVSDLVFAVDSIPAVFAITSDPFIVFTSNIFAILGLRSLYFLLAGMLDRFCYLKVGLATVLVFVGLKMLVSGIVKIPILLSLGVIGGVLAGSVIASLWVVRKRGEVASECQADKELLDKKDFPMKVK
ncbi:MAG: TerC family protein [candidate division Zixibacteria bacterium]|nr:TerC family protein [candidate division Zixibacteria bacterium]